MPPVPARNFRTSRGHAKGRAPPGGAPAWLVHVGSDDARRKPVPGQPSLCR